MLKVLLNGKDVSAFMQGSFKISRKKTERDSGLYIDVVNLTMRNTENIFTPGGTTSLISENYIETEIELFYGDKRVFTGFLRNLREQDSGRVILEIVNIIGKISSCPVEYKTADRGGGDFPSSEYTSAPDGYWETPAYAAYHLFRSAGVPIDDINLASLADADAAYGVKLIRIHKPESLFMSLMECLNIISDFCFLYIYIDRMGKITFSHDKTFTSVNISGSVYSNIAIDNALHYYNDYLIQTADGTFRRAEDNADFGAQYRNGNIRPLSITNGLITIKDNTAADAIGEYAINNYSRKRHGINFSTRIDYDIISFETSLSITAARLGANNLECEIYEIIDDYGTLKKTIKAYEIL